MKNSNYIINGILIVAIIVLFILQFTGNKTNTKSPNNLGFVADSTGFHLPIAYINTDSLLSNYKFYLDLSDDLLKKQEDKSLDIKRRDDNLKKQIADFYQKAQNNIFITPERAQQEENRLLGLRQDLENYVAQISQEMSIEQAKMNKQLTDTITTALKDFNTPKKYEFILSNVGTDNILYADDSYDITVEATEFLNARYVPSKK